jgi:hypothetical protein
MLVKRPATPSGHEGVIETTKENRVCLAVAMPGRASVCR